MSRAKRVFRSDDQEAFAALSGDWNPAHTDPLEARRLIFGAQVVHGVHALLWALEQLTLGREGFRLTRLRAEFRAPLLVGEEVEADLQVDGDAGRATVTASRGVGLRLQATWEAAGADSPTLADERFAREAPSRPDAAGLGEAQGSLGLKLDVGLAAEVLPHLAAALSAAQLAELLAATRLVGMTCPGLHSIFGALTLEARPDPSDQAVLGWEVRSHDARLSRVELGLAGPTLTGTAMAFVRPTACGQPSLEALRPLVGDGRFAGERALVVGGSRGLGELCAKLLAAGDAEVVLTYRVGAADAERVRDEIRDAGGAADLLAFDVLAGPSEMAAALVGQSPFTRLCYFATPFIFAARRGSFTPELFQRFCDYYLTGFLNTFRALDPSPPHVLYPSSEAVTTLELGLGEYAAAKAAGEQLCAFLEKCDKGLSIRRPRLPRLPSDQSASVLAVETADPAPLLLDALG